MVAETETEADLGPTSYDLALRQWRRLDALAELVSIAEQYDAIDSVDGLAELLKDAARAAGDLLEMLRAEKEARNG
ncbi:MAG: hypothetical protein ACR652_10925 [Methylocystis sp.]|uniref:hypothetical protein n=1 Tax=Methylocystis sp. TaxID=1911079 RepID=UPI003DA2A6E2